MIGVGFTIWGSVAWQRKGEACGAERASAHRFRECSMAKEGGSTVAWVVLSGAISCDTLCHGLHGVGGRIFMRRRR